MEIESLNHIVTPEQYEQLEGIRVKSCWSCGNAAVISLASSCACCSDSICHASEEWIPVVAWNRRAEPSGLRELVSEIKVMAECLTALCGRARDHVEEKVMRTNSFDLYKKIIELEAVLADTEPSVPQPQSKTLSHE